MKIRPHGAPNTAPTFADLKYGDLFLLGSDLCVKCKDLRGNRDGFMFMGTGNVFIEAPMSFAPAPGEYVVSNEVKA